jgi:hypothetical protein
MRWLFCWRCGIEMPMLDEAEFVEIEPLFRTGLRLGKQMIEEQHGSPVCGTSYENRFRPLLDAYERLTGFRETNPNAVMHHRLALYGPPCEACGKPLRSNRASQCLACGRLANEHRR